MEDVSDADLLRRHAVLEQEMRHRGLQPSAASTNADTEDYDSDSDTSTIVYTPDGSYRTASSRASSVRYTPANSHYDGGSVSDMIGTESVQDESDHR